VQCVYYSTDKLKSDCAILQNRRSIMGFLTGKTAIITGAGRAVLSDGRCGSIGYGIATAYAKEGANLVITGRNVKKLADAKEELETDLSDSRAARRSGCPRGRGQ
jgi:NAD(P)-dependent dehydrogenase (short-subunit alcohol dehydrogenase family)